MFASASRAYASARAPSSSIGAQDRQLRARLAATKEAGMTEVADQFTEERSGEVTRIAHWIDGQRVEGASGRSGPVYNPATGERTGEVDFATVEEVDAAVQAAKRAFA